MKKTLLALLLVLALCLPTFVGCDTSETPKQTDEKPSGDVVEHDTTVDDGNKGEDENKDYSEIYKDPYDVYEELTNKGYTGSFEEWVESLKGADGADGKSAYQLAVENGYTGTVEEWLLSLVGAPGKDGADGKDGIDGAPGKDGVDGEDGKDGLDGKSVYDLAVENGFKGTLEDWLLSLVGADGKDGVDGAPGKDGADGAPGKDGEDGKDGDKGDKGETGATIEKVEFDEQGRLVITLTDGTVIEPVEIPEKEVHEHTYGELIAYVNNDSLSCENRLYYRSCTQCKEAQWIQGSADDHNYSRVCYIDVNNHCYKCVKCGDATDAESHNVGWVSDADGHSRSGCDVCGIEAVEKTAHDTEIVEIDTYTKTKRVWCSVCGYLVSTQTCTLVHDWESDAEGHWIIGCELCGVWDREKVAHSFEYECVDGVCSAECSYCKYSKDVSTLTIEEAIEIGSAQDHNVFTDEKYLVSGEITEITNTIYGNCYIKDTAGNTIHVYGISNHDGSVGFENIENRPRVGDTVTLLGKVGQYDGFPELTSSWLVSQTRHSCIFSDATCTTPSECTICGEIKSDALGHVIVYHEAKEPTCTEAGWYRYADCSRCGWMEIDYVEIPAYGHLEEEYNAKAPTCTEVGWNAYVACPRCDYTTYEELQPIPHQIAIKTGNCYIGSNQTACEFVEVDNDYFASREEPGFVDRETAWMTLLSTNSETSRYEVVATKDVTVEFKCGIWVRYNEWGEVLDKLCVYLNGELLYQIGDISAWWYWFDGSVKMKAWDVLTFEYRKIEDNESNWQGFAGVKLMTPGDELEYVDVTDELIAGMSARCTEDISCVMCGHVYVESLGGHDEIEHSAKAPTCTDVGWDAYVTCSRCDYTTYREKAALGHDEVFVYDDDEHWLECQRCHETKDIVSHSVGEDGYCTVCDKPMQATAGVVYILSTSGDHAEVIDYTGSSSRVIIAEEYEGGPVRKIAANAFTDKYITSVSIPDSVTSIGDRAFYKCYSLTSVVIPDSVTSIGDEAFYRCSGLIEKIDGVSYVDNCVIDFDNSLAVVTLKDGARIICDSVFSDSSKLRSITIPDSVTSIGDRAFYNCYSLTSVVIPDSVTSIGDYAFSNCTSLASVVIPDSVTSIGDRAFYNCYSLTSVVIPDSVTSIGDYAFSNCTSLASVEIPDSVTSIGDYAFRYCTSLTSIKYRGTQGQWNEIDKGYGWNYNTGNYTITYNYTGE